MTKARYGIGDVVILKDGPLRHARTENEFKVTAVLPDSDGQVQYRVRSEREGFDRRVAAGEIDIERSAASKHVVRAPDQKDANEPWFKAASIKINK